MPDIEPIYKVTILARGRTGGHAVAVRRKTRVAHPLGDDLATGVRDGRSRGRGAGVSRTDHGRGVRHRAGHQNCRAMVTEFGMSSKLGAVKYGTEHGDPFLAAR
ncbi:peptidase M41 family protein [Mycobacterium xenopi 3993]|nr:peptidase M41 family protein [Mycobacterium xenopi 3993]